MNIGSDDDSRDLISSSSPALPFCNFEEFPFIQSIIEVGDTCDETIVDGSADGMVRTPRDEANRIEHKDDDNKEEKSENHTINNGGSTIQSKSKN